jgi:hypothetical protein
MTEMPETRILGTSNIDLQTTITRIFCRENLENSPGKVLNSDFGPIRLGIYENGPRAQLLRLRPHRLLHKFQVTLGRCFEGVALLQS